MHGRFLIYVVLKHLTVKMFVFRLNRSPQTSGNLNYLIVTHSRKNCDLCGLVYNYYQSRLDSP